MPAAIFINSSLILRIRFGFGGLVNIHRQPGDICRNPSRLVFGEQLCCGLPGGLILDVDLPCERKKSRMWNAGDGWHRETDGALLL
jgi:hypothetical protein